VNEVVAVDDQSALWHYLMPACTRCNATCRHNSDRVRLYHELCCFLFTINKSSCEKRKFDL